MFVRMSNSPLTTAMQLAIGFVFLPSLVWSAWSKAWQFDPYTMSYFTKTYVVPTPEMPDELRIAGLVMFLIAALPGYAGIKGIVKRIGKLRENLLLLWVGCLIAAFGGAFFVAAETAQVRIYQEQQKSSSGIADADAAGRT
ncbi:hypothetical protein [Futiania mangrovi]|uniref:Uncharacterized protein n=1 Tax=Futiania mangrovi TaxID=2959716 RepID=A0A9J6PH41_9PROT|nr:hypothetical protein [Futiania mangrovii]MCP1337814.1 hypothetical protein [Futiania mangrovii]